LKDQCTQMPVEGERWLFDQLGQGVGICSQFMKPGSQSEIDRQAVERYMNWVVEFHRKLAMLMHISGEQPARGPEILSVRHRNTVQSGHCNVFIEDGMVVFVTLYYKGYNVSSNVKIIHRYLPREVGELVVWYMWLVLPFQQRLEALVWEKEVVSSHMWPADPNGCKWTTDRLCEALKRETRIAMGQEWTFARYRVMAIGISWWFLHGSTAFQANEREEKGDNEETAEVSIADEQADHTLHVAGLVYARRIMEQAGAVADKRQQFRASSTDWHRFLGFQANVDDGTKSRKRKRAPFEREAAEAIEAIKAIEATEEVEAVETIEPVEAVEIVAARATAQEPTLITASLVDFLASPKNGAKQQMTWSVGYQERRQVSGWARRRSKADARDRET
jgi:hypothetical protein